MKLMLYWTLIGLQIKRIKPAERRLPSPNVTNWPDWTDATRSFRVRSQSGTSPGVFNEEGACRKNRFLTASLTVSDDERGAGELAVLHLLLYDVLLQGSCLSELRRRQRSSAPRLQIDSIEMHCGSYVPLCSLLMSALHQQQLEVPIGGAAPSFTVSGQVF